MTHITPVPRSVQRNRPQAGGQNRTFQNAGCLLLVVATVGLLAACGSPSQRPSTADAESSVLKRTPQTLNPGDVIKISFPGAPNLDTTQQIRRDGRINLTLIGEVYVADKTPAALEKELQERYSPQLVSKEITVTVVSSSYAVFVAGAVLKPGKIMPEREITALEAVMEAGGFDSAKANSSAVVVIRHADGKTINFRLNLKAPLRGKPTEPFYLKSHDIVYVPEKFTWF